MEHKKGHDFTKPAVCPKCKQLTLNWGRMQRYPDIWYRKASCRPCYQARAKEWRKKNPDKVAASARRVALKRFYGITQNEYDSMFTNQKGKCMICDTTSKRTLAVDHDHATGKVRGLLCHHCNKGIGQFFDNPELLLNAIEYLQWQS